MCNLKEYFVHIRRFFQVTVSTLVFMVQQKQNADQFPTITTSMAKENDEMEMDPKK